ncbi:MAG: hypothetical protein MI717_05755 [Spirochaetales bacterium]|nr:hypothetical protein [Spirochaetales bacterium]
MRKIFCVLSLAFFMVPLFAIGPEVFEGEEAVTIYRDFDDGRFGRSLYREVLFSLKPACFARYSSLNVAEGMDGRTAYLVSQDRAQAMTQPGKIPGLVRVGEQGERAPDVFASPHHGAYHYQTQDLDIVFALERASETMYEEILRTYSSQPQVAQLVTQSYQNGYVVRVIRAENAYRPHIARLDYEDVLLTAAFVGNRFQPLWGIHDGNALGL